MLRSPGFATGAAVGGSRDCTQPSAPRKRHSACQLLSSAGASAATRGNLRGWGGEPLVQLRPAGSSPACCCKRVGGQRLRLSTVTWGWRWGGPRSAFWRCKEDRFQGVQHPGFSDKLLVMRVLSAPARPPNNPAAPQSGEMRQLFKAAYGRGRSSLMYCRRRPPPRLCH